MTELDKIGEALLFSNVLLTKAHEKGQGTRSTYQWP